MEYPLSEEHSLLRETISRFVSEELIPIEMKTRESATELKAMWRTHFAKRGRDLGIMNMEVPEEYGGMGSDLLALVIVWEQLYRSVALPTRGLGGILGPQVRAPLYSLSTELKSKYLEPILRGEITTCFAQTEADAGSDPSAMRTTAERQGDSYIINGTKRFIQGADTADLCQLMAVTDRAKGVRGGISMFLVDMKTPGVKIAAKYMTMMGESPCELHFDDVRVPVKNRIGDEGDGFRLGQQFLMNGRLKHGARSLGITQRCLDLMTSYALQRSTFGQKLAQRQAIQWMIVDTHVDLQAARLMVYNTAARASAGQDVRTDAYIQKMYSVELAFRAADACMQIHGGIGLTTDMPIERLWREARGFRITEGPTEVMKMTIARNILRRYQ